MGNQPNEGGAQKEPAVGLKRTLGLREAITITAGTVIGVGLFTTGGNVVGEMGPFVVLATALAALISIYPALMYGEMGAALPFAGGTYQYASLGLGRPAGFLAGWNFIMSLIAVTGGEALAFSYYFKTIFLAFGIDLPVDDVVIAIIALVAFIIANVRGVELTGKLQNGFMFFFWGVAAIWFLTMIPNVQLPNFVTAPDFMGDLGSGGFIAAVLRRFRDVLRHGRGDPPPADQHPPRHDALAVHHLRGERPVPVVPRGHRARRRASRRGRVVRTLR